MHHSTLTPPHPLLLSLLLLTLSPFLLPFTTSTSVLSIPSYHLYDSIISTAPLGYEEEDVRLKRNSNLFPGEYFPPGYDVGLSPYQTGSIQTSRVIEATPIYYTATAKAARGQRRKWAQDIENQRIGDANRGSNTGNDDDANNSSRYGRLLLIIYVRHKDELSLDFVLPKWANLIDYFIIGVDSRNKDESLEMIKTHFSHLPGIVAELSYFDGLGSTWNALVQLGIHAFPGASHGLLSEVYYQPMESSFDRSFLDLSIAQYQLRVLSTLTRKESRIDTLYRNVPGVYITRRAYPVVTVPILDPLDVEQVERQRMQPPPVLPTLVLQEPGVKTSKEQEKVIRLLKKDAQDMPKDDRTMYYMGVMYRELYIHEKNKPEPDYSSMNKYLKESIDLFDKLTSLQPHEIGLEQRWTGLMKIAELYELSSQWEKAELYYKRAMFIDRDKADPYYAIGWHLRQADNNYTGADGYLRIAATMSVPRRKLQVFNYLYQCQSKLEYARNWRDLGRIDQSRLPALNHTQLVSNLLLSAKCTQEHDKEDVKQLSGIVRQVIETTKKEEKAKLKKKQEKKRKKEAAKRQKEEEEEERREKAKKKEEKEKKKEEKKNRKKRKKERKKKKKKEKEKAKKKQQEEEAAAAAADANAKKHDEL